MSNWKMFWNMWCQLDFRILLISVSKEREESVCVYVCMYVYVHNLPNVLIRERDMNYCPTLRLVKLVYMFILNTK